MKYYGVIGVNVETGRVVEFDSISEAAEGLDRDYSTVRRAVTGDRGIVSCAGYVLTGVEAATA